MLRQRFPSERDDDGILRIPGYRIVSMSGTVGSAEPGSRTAVVMGVHCVVARVHRNRWGDRSCRR